MGIFVSKKCKDYFKLNKYDQSIVREMLCGLADKISNFNNSINEIFNHDDIIYDRINNEIFIYKARYRTVQYRLVYGYINKDVYLIDFVTKKKNNKEYINEVNEKYANSSVLGFDYVEV